MKISISILKTKKEKETLIKELGETSCDSVHIDLTDGLFAGEKNYELETLIPLLQRSSKPLDIHLMVKNPSDEILKLKKLQPERITIHYEIPNHQKYLSMIRENHIKVGLAINPETTVEEIKDDLKDLDTILVLGVHPGYGGQAFIPETLEKLKELKELQSHYSYEILIDGGVNEEVVKMIKPYVDVMVSGSFVCDSENMENQIQKLKNLSQ